jgi:hypothetical protein
MMLKLALHRTGNSVGLVLPKDAFDDLGADEGDTAFLAYAKMIRLVCHFIATEPV